MQPFPGTLRALPHFAGSHGFPLPPALTSLFAEGRLLAVSFQIDMDCHGYGAWTDQIAVHLADPMGGPPTCLTAWSQLAPLGLPGLAEALLSVAMPRPVAASALTRAWKRAGLPTRPEQEDTTELALTILPSGMVLSLHDPLDHFGPYKHSLRPQDMHSIRQLDDAFAQGSDAFRTALMLSQGFDLWAGLGAWLVPADIGGQPPSAHSLVPLVGQGAQVAREWAKIQPLDASLPWLAHLDWRGPSGEAIAAVLTRD